MTLEDDTDLAGYRDVPAYIYGITREIWEGRGIGGLLDQYYAADINVRAPSGLTHGNAGVAAQTLATLHQFPDRQLIGEDVIWTPAPDRSFLSSHRLVSVMTHIGDGAYGVASGRPVRSRIIADCWVQDGMVKEEWLVRDQGGYARCLGMDAEQLARSLNAQEIAATGSIAVFTPDQDRPSRYTPVVADDPTVAFLVAHLDRLWNAKDLRAIRALYFAGANLHPPGGFGTRYGHDDLDRFFVGYLSSFPEARWTVDSATINRDPERPVRVALRWSLSGRHSGFGHFGAPSGAHVHVMGMSHFHLTEDAVHAEWMVTDEVAIWKQILGARG